MSAGTETRPDPRDLVSRRARVRITNPGNGSHWEGDVIACHDDPGIVIEQTGCHRICLPSAFEITEIEQVDPPAIVAARFSTPAYIAARNAAQAVIRARYRAGMDAHEARRLAVAVTEAIYDGVYQALTEVPW